MKINFKEEIGKCLEEQFQEIIMKALGTKISSRKLYVEEEILNYANFLSLMDKSIKILRVLEGGKNGSKTKSTKTN